MKNIEREEALRRIAHMRATEEPWITVAFDSHETANVFIADRSKETFLELQRSFVKTKKPNVLRSFKNWRREDTNPFVVFWLPFNEPSRGETLLHQLIPCTDLRDLVEMIAYIWHRTILKEQINYSIFLEAKRDAHAVLDQFEVLGLFDDPDAKLNGVLVSELMKLRRH
jgi:hypothetical protein